MFCLVFRYLWAPRGGELPADTTKMAAGGERSGERRGLEEGFTSRYNLSQGVGGAGRGRGRP